MNFLVNYPFIASPAGILLLYSNLNQYFLVVKGTQGKKHIFKVPPQPLWFNKEAANMRKLYELPYHLALAGKWEELHQSVLGEFLTTKFSVAIKYMGKKTQI